MMMKKKVYNDIQSTLPLIQQITDRGLKPFFLVGVLKRKGNVIESFFANHSDDLNDFMYTICKNFVVDYEKNNPHLIEPPRRIRGK